MPTTKKPAAVEIRTYQVGFGDCFLLSFLYSETDRRHVLIDFGTMRLPGKKPKGQKEGKEALHMRMIATAIKDVCSVGELTAVIATHRHQDHISGFGTENRTGKSGDIIRGLEPKVVIQPWTEDPDARTNATAPTKNQSPSARFVAGLEKMHDISRMVLELAAARPPWLSERVAKQLEFLGSDNIANRSAVENLIAMGERDGATAVYASHGSRSGLEKKLPGVTVHVLGPPTLQQSTGIRSQRADDPDQFWHLVSAGGPNPLANGLAKVKAGKGDEVPANARWFRDRLDRMRGRQLLEIVRTLDSQMNNTSLILVLEVMGKKLLFPGDAQIENWTYALQDAPDAAKTRKLLADIDLYKVGHHGSLNATPKKLLWEKLKKRGTKKQLTTLLSTMRNVHGHVESDTEVPRRTLVSALAKDTALTSTLDLKSEHIGYVVRLDAAGISTPTLIPAP